MKKTLLNYLLSAVFSMILIGGKCFAQLTIAEWNFPTTTADAIVDVFVPLNNAQVISTVGGTSAITYGTPAATTWSASATAWTTGSLVKWWEIQINTTGYYNLEISSKQYSSATGPRDFRVDYKIGAGAWTTLTGTITVATNFTTGVINNFALPVACENQPSVFLRWIMISNTSVGGATVGAGGNSKIDDINISANDALNHYRSIASGNWSNPAIWQASPTATWPGVAATYAPSRHSQTITISTGTTVTINSNASMDELTVQNGGTLNYASGSQTINDGATAVDFQVDGTFNDAGATSTIWSGAAPRWSLGANGTYIKSGATSAQTWRDNYNGGISTIPASAFWYVRKTSATNPSLTTTNNMFYPNLTIENVAGGNWATAAGSIFTGSTNFPTIKGNFDIGGVSGLGTVDFLCDNTNATPVQVQGDMYIRSGSTLRNNGTGFELFKNLTVDGSANYAAANARKFKFSGGNAQIIAGTGTLASFGVYQMQVTKSANDITLNRPVKVNNNLDLQWGIINSSNPNYMVVEDNATVTGPVSNVSFVRGPVRKLRDEAFTFPVGKNNDYQAIGFSAGPPGGGPTTFWTENFNTGAGWSLANVLGAEGSDPNFFQVTANEGGVTPPGCGVANNGNNTLHVTSVFFPSGGAAYDAGGLCGFLYCPQTNRRAQSPVINCTGRSTITLSFNFIGNGSGLVDNASLWYYDGAAWSMIAASLKSTVCGSGQGRWTAYSIVLPASADNNPNVRIGFKWENNDDGVGTDPSFAVDDIALSVTGTTDQFTAEYFYTNPQTPYGNSLLPNLAVISNCEYWILTRDVGTSNRLVTLSFDANSCGFQSDPANLVVANHNSGDWYDRGNGGYTASTVTSFAAQSVYGPFTLGSIVPLPLELLNFDAKYNNKTVDLKWITASEKNNDYFTVERTKDGKLFNEIAIVKGAGNSTSIHNYVAEDKNPANGISFYRLKQTDFNSSFSYSNLVAVEINNNLNALSYFYADAANSEILYMLAGEVDGDIKCDITDMFGRVVFSEDVISKGKEIIKLKLPEIAKGIYSLRLSNNSYIVVKKFFY